jgi:predicted enzyme related to lactoylglutathione lyase
MTEPGNAAPGQFCWLDLAASDAGTAQAFYEQLFGWTSEPQRANGGFFTRLLLSGREIGSMYELRRLQLAQGVPSHWTPYVRVTEAEDAARRAISAGGQVVVAPFTVSGVARIALIQDSVGALIGLWEPLVASGDGK